MCGDCRRRPPAEVCVECIKMNGSCKIRCSDAFIYDPERTDEEIVSEIKARYKIGGNPEGLEMELKVPERILALLAQS